MLHSLLDSSPDTATGHPEEAAVAHAGNPAAAPTVLVLARRARQGTVLALLHRLAPGASVRMARDSSEATFRLALGGVDLVVLDLQCEPTAPLPLVQLLARLSPSTLFVLLGEPQALAAMAPYATQPWSRAEPALRGAFEALEMLGALAPPVAPGNARAGSAGRVA